MKNIINYIGFATGWYCLIKYGNTAIPFVFTYLLAHILYMKNKRLELITIAIVSCIGFFSDTALTFAHIIQFKDLHSLPPYWFMMLWPLFASMLNHCLKIFYKVHCLLNCFLGAAGGMLAYIAGEHINSSFSVNHNMNYIICITWALLFPLFVVLSGWLRSKYE
ncbi:DUF2878 domain-containing protein [Gammaproteobacteria bacterium]|nr:DUF2878 domain-containing protein [Gammaproteobacteria bacterium]